MAVNVCRGGCHRGGSGGKGQKQTYCSKKVTQTYANIVKIKADGARDKPTWEDIPNRMPDHDVTVNAYITGIAAAGKGLALGEYEIYSLDGKKLNDLQIGVNIIRYPNGTTQKIFIR